jgi:hypothetical protein
MSYQDHYRTCSYCQKSSENQKLYKAHFSESSSKKSFVKPTIRVKSASSHERERKLIELGHMIKGVQTTTKGGSFIENTTRKQGPIEKTMKLRELAKMIKGL